MKRKIVHLTFLIFIISLSSYTILNTIAENAYTTTITTQIPTTLTETLEETSTTTITSDTTKTETKETPFLTRQTIIQPQTITQIQETIIPTTIVMTYFVTTCWGNEWERECDVETRQKTAVKSLMSKVTVRSIINTPTTIQYLTTSHYLTTETIETTFVEQVINTQKKLITSTIENTYTSTVTSSPLQTTPDQTEFTISTPLSNSVMWIAIIVIIIVIASALFLRQRRTHPPSQTTPTTFCINCGKPIPKNSKHCSECGAAQK